jgi:phosphoenolpyruvate carboxykinase (GTP)
VFGGRRRAVAPLVYEARNFRHGVLVGASVASETTAAAAGTVGVVRRDPMAMQPFCGYNFADYWQHWLDIGGRLTRPPPIFHVNWFRRGADNRFLWPGYGENLRVLAWMLERAADRVGAQETPIGRVPRPQDLNLDGLDIGANVVHELLRVDGAAWREEFAQVRRYFEQYGARLPAVLMEELAQVEGRLAGA